MNGLPTSKSDQTTKTTSKGRQQIANKQTTHPGIWLVEVKRSKKNKGTMTNHHHRKHERSTYIRLIVVSVRGFVLWNNRRGEGKGVVVVVVMLWGTSS
jgi:hypothetical protein